MRKSTILLMLLGLLAWGCGGEDVPPGTNSTGDIGILVLGPQSGPSGNVGEELRRTIELALDEVPERSVAGRRIVPVYVDSQSDPDIAAAAYTTALTNADNNAVLGFFNWHSNVSLEVMEVAADNRFVHFAALGATGEINERVAGDPERYAVWSKGWPTPSKLVVNYIAAVEEAIENGTFDPGDRIAGLFQEDSSWGEGVAAALKTELEAAGWTVAAEVVVPADGIDFTTQVQELRAANVTLIGGSIASGASLTFVSQVNSAFEDTQPPLILSEGLGWNADWFETLGDGANNVVDQSPLFVTPEAQAFAERYEAQWGSAPSPTVGGLAYDYFRAAVQLLERTQEEYGSISQETLLEAHRDLVLTGEFVMEDGILMPRYSWNAESGPDPVVGETDFSFPVIQYMTGNVQVVWPSSLADSALEGPTAAE